MNTSSSAFARVYRFTTTQSGTVTLDMTAPFEPRLYLFNARGSYIAGSHTTNSAAVRIFEGLDPGTYQLVATATNSSTGTFRISTWFRNGQICPLTQISLDASQSGSVDNSSCRVGDLMIGSSNENFAAQYRFSLTQRGTVTIEAFSDVYEPRVYLLDSRYRYITSSRATSSTSTRTFESLDPGTYVIAVIAEERATGAFTLAARFRNPQICPISAIGLTASAGGLFTTTSCRLGDLMFGSSNQGFAAQYTVTLSQRGTLTVDAASGELQPTIYLTDARYRYITSSRRKSSTEAHTFEALNPGAYVVIVFAEPGETGEYTVSTDFRNPEICPSENIANGSSDQDTLTPGSCKVGDLDWGSSNENYAKQYRIHLTQRTKLVVGMHSDDFDSTLYLYNSRFNYVASDDNSGQGFDAKITETLDAGDYIVVAFARDGATGSYTLNTGDEIAPTPDPSGTVVLLLHGLNSEPGTWDRFVGDAMAGDCPVLTDEVIQGGEAPVSRCYRYAFGARSSAGFEWLHGDGLTYSELGESVGSAVDFIRSVANPVNIILVGHSRGGLAARAYLQSLTAPQPVRFGLLTIGTPHLGSPFGRIGVWLNNQGYTPDNQIDLRDELYFIYSPSTSYLATASDSLGRPVRSPVSKPIWDLNDGAGKLNGVVSVYGQIASNGRELGSFPVTGFLNLNLLNFAGILPGERDQLRTYVLENASEDWRENGDGIVPVASQRLANIPGFKLGADLWYLDLNRVFHTQETDYSFDILRVLNRMRTALPPASATAASPSPAQAARRTAPLVVDETPQSIDSLERAYRRGEVQPLIRAAADPRYDSGEFTAAVLRLLAEDADVFAQTALCRALARNGSSAATEAIFRIAASPASRTLALDALGAIERSGAVDALAHHAGNDPVPELRLAAIRALGRQNTPESSEALLRLALIAEDDQDPVIHALADLPSLKSVEAVKKAVAEFSFLSETVRQRLHAIVEARERGATPQREPGER